MTPGARSKFGAPHVQIRDFSEANALSRRVTSLGHQGGKEFSEWPKLFKVCPTVLNYFLHIFPRGEIFCTGGIPPASPLVTGLCTILNKVLVPLLGLFGVLGSDSVPRSDSAPGELYLSCPLRYAPGYIVYI